MYLYTGFKQNKADGSLDINCRFSVEFDVKLWQYGSIPDFSRKTINYSGKEYEKQI